MLKEFTRTNLTDSLASNLVNIEDKTRSNPFTWRGQFSPQLIEQILINYGDEKNKVLDPFLGSGTVLYESALLGLEAYGCEINPAAVAFAKVYELANKPKDQVISTCRSIDEMVSKYLIDLPLFETSDISQYENELLENYKKARSDIKKIIYLSLITGMDFGAKKVDRKRIGNIWETLKNNIKNLPFTDTPIKCFNSDAREIPLSSNSIDLVVTSPPYINVFNYHQNYRKSIEKTGVDILSVAKSEIGANRKFRQNRFLTVVQYCMDMSLVFIELRRVCKKNAKIIFIVGRESNVRKTPFKNAELIKSVAEICGFNMVGEQPRVFLNKFGASIFEEIMKFEIDENSNIGNFVEDARNIGQIALKGAFTRCTQEVKNEIKEAIEKSNNIDASPILGTL